MRKTYRRRLPTKPDKKFRVNEQIQAQEVRVIGDEGEHIGIIPIAEALKRAAESELDLIEVEPTAEPPVCRMMDYGKFQYEQEKQKRKAKAKQKSTETKGIRLSLRIGTHDFEVRIKQTKEFLSEGDEVKVELVLRGRERQHKDLANTIIQDFIKKISEGEDGIPLQPLSPITLQGGRLSTIVRAKK